MNRASTEATLRDWRYGQTQAERLCAAVLALEGYERIDPQHPLGGPDGRKDLLCRRAGKLWVAAVYFPGTAVTFADITRKFNGDAGGVSTNSADGFIFFANQHISIAERQQLLAKVSFEAEIYHVERIRFLLDSPRGCGARLEYLRIPMTEEEQWAFWASTNHDITQHVRDTESHIRRIDVKLNILLSGRSTGAHPEVDDTKLAPLPGKTSSEWPMSSLSWQTVCWVHRLVTDGSEVQPAFRGKIRSEPVWLGDSPVVPTDTAGADSYVMVSTALMSLFDWWRSKYREVLSKDKTTVVSVLAEFYSRFLSLHPFIDGNKRVAYALLDQAAHELIEMRVSPELLQVSSLADALGRAWSKDPRALEDLISAALS